MRLGVALGLIVVTTIATRAPLALLPRPYGDEPIYALAGHQWLAGHLPYTLLWDVKPPGLFALFALSEALTGDPMVGQWLLPLIAVGATAIALWRISMAWCGDARMGMIAVALYAPWAFMLEGASETSELILAPFVAFGLLAAGREGLRHAFIAGLLFGVAGCVKQVAIFEALVAGAIVLAVNRRSLAFLLYGAGAALPLAAFALLFALEGQLDPALQAVVVSALRRAEGEGLSIANGIVRLAWRVQLVAPLLVCAGCAWLMRERLWPGQPALRFAWLGYWLLAAVMGAVFVRAAYDHHLLTLLPPLVLVASRFLAEASRRARGPARRAGIVALLAAFWLAPSAWLSWRGEWPFGDNDVHAILDALREQGLRPGPGQLYVADHEPSLYLLTGTLQPTRFVVPTHLVCPFPLPADVEPATELERIMASRPRFVVITSGRGRFVCTQPDRMAIVGQALEAGYERVAVVGNARDPVEVWRRKGH